MIPPRTKRITINAVSLIDLQLKLAQRENWRILEISRLNFGFKIIFQRRAKEGRRGLSDGVPRRAFMNRNFVSRRRSALSSNKAISPK